MKNTFRQLFLPLLQPLEAGEEPYQYKGSHRTILITVGILFLVLATIAGTVAILVAQYAGLFPCLIFFLAGLVCVVIGLLGTDRAVAKLWGSKPGTHGKS